MAPINPGNFMKIWTQDDEDSRYFMQKYLLGGLDRIVMARSKVTPRIKKGPSIYNPEVTWMEEKAYPSVITGQLTDTGTKFTITGSLFGTVVTAINIRKVLRVGSIIQRPNTRDQYKVTSMAGVIDGSPFEATVEPYGNSTPADDSGAISWRIISEVWSDFKDVDESRELGRDKRKVGTQIHAETFEIPKTRKNTRYEIVGDEVQHQIMELLEKLRRGLDSAVLHSRPYHDGQAFGYGTITQEPTMCGLLTWPELLQAEQANTAIYINAASQPTTKTQINDLVRNLFLTEHANYDAGDWAIICHPLQHEYMHDFDISFRITDKDEKSVGFYVDAFDSKIGKKFPIISDQYMREDVIQLVDFSQCSYGYYNDDELDRKEIATKGRYQQWLMSFQTYGVVVRKPRQSVGAQIYGLPTS